MRISRYTGKKPDGLLRQIQRFDYIGPVVPDRPGALCTGDFAIGMRFVDNKLPGVGRSFLICIIVSILMFSAASFAAGGEKIKDSAYIKFLTGIYLINSTNELNDQQKAQRYSQLIEDCAIDKDSVLSFAARYYNKPDEWKKIHEKIQTLLSEYENYRKNDTITSKIDDNSKMKETGRSK